MDKTSHIYGNPRAGAIGAVLMYVLLACVLAALFCWRVASTAPQAEDLTTEEKK